VRGSPVCVTSSQSSRPALISCFYAATMKRVFSTGDIASSPIGDSIDNGGPFTLQKGRRKKQRKANPVTVTHSITDDTDALRSTQPILSLLNRHNVSLYLLLQSSRFCKIKLMSCCVQSVHNRRQLKFCLRSLTTFCHSWTHLAVWAVYVVLL